MPTPLHEVSTGYDVVSEYGPCTACERVTGLMHRHHWQYGDDEIKTQLCETCHNACHRPRGNTPHQEHTDPEWQLECLKVLIDIRKEEVGEVSEDWVLDRINFPEHISGWREVLLPLSD